MSTDAEYDSLFTGFMEDLSHELNTPDDLQQIFGEVTRAAVDLISGVDYADILIIDGDRFRSIAPTAQLATQIDEVQLRLQQGPCLQAAQAEEVIRCNELRHEQRWPQFAVAAVKMGVLSMLSYQLYTHRGGAGALNLLSRNPGAHSIEAEALGASLAAHAAVAITSMNRQQQFRSALASRDTIGRQRHDHGAIPDRRSQCVRPPQTVVTGHQHPTAARHRTTH